MSSAFDLLVGNFWFLNIAEIRDGDRSCDRCPVSPFRSRDKANAFPLSPHLGPHVRSYALSGRSINAGPFDHLANHIMWTRNRNDGWVKHLLA